MTSRSSLRGEIAGGIAAGVVAIPISIGYGMLAFGALGEPFIPAAILAGLYSAVIVSLVVLLLGHSAPTAFAPRSIIAVLFAAAIADTVVPAARRDPANVDRTLAVVVVIVLTAGLFQTVVGVLGLGNAIRYIPSPVMAGFQNAVAILLLAAQLNPLLGVGVPLSRVPSAALQGQPLTLAVGLLTVLVIWCTPRVTRRVPAPIAGLAVGTALYYALSLLGLGAHLGPVLGEIPAVVPSLGPVAAVPALVADPSVREHWPAIIGAALSLAFVASLDTLLCARAADSITGQRTPPSPQLLRIGLGNVAAGLVAAMPSGINLGSTSAMSRAGGRTGLASALSALVILAAILGLGPVLGRIPRAVIAGVVVVVALQLFDRPSLQRLLRLLRRRDRHWRLAALDLSVVALVAVVTVALDLVWAVGIGVSIAIVLFLYRMSRSVVRRSYRGDVVRSKRIREPRLTEYLAATGHRIVVFELEGPIFFGTAEKLARHIEAATHGDTVFVILDLRRVNEVDSTGAAILLQTAQRLRAGGRHLLLSHLAPDAPAISAVRDAGLTLTRETAFADVDAALEWAEDALIAAEEGLQAGPLELSMDEIPVLAGLSESDQALIAARLQRTAYRAGDVVIRQGDTDRNLYIVARGTITVRVGVEGTTRQVRLVSYSRGTVFGEMALLDRQPRSATVVADDEAVCYALPEAAFDAIIKDHPLIAVRLLANLARELSVRLRNATRIIAELER
jgi:MFS superfamily sulfate permease-like transporter